MAKKKAAKKKDLKKGKKKPVKQIKVVHLTNSLAQIITWLQAMREALLTLNPDMVLPCEESHGVLTAGKTDRNQLPRMGNCPPPDDRPRLGECPPPED